MSGPDRPGLINSLSETISECNANWEGSRMAQFAGHFAGVVHVVVSSIYLEQLKQSLSELVNEGMFISVVENINDPAGEVIPNAALALEVVGQDRTGIVSEISQTLATRGVNVIELITECSSAPMSGERLFEADAVIVIPAGVTEEEVREDIENIAHDLAVTITRIDE